MDDLEDPEEIKMKRCKTTTDVQRLKLEKLMKNIDKPAFIPQKRKEKDFPDAPDFVRNVMGSSAGAGSGEFHVYRHIRRREYSREQFLQKKKEVNELDEAYHKKLEQNKLDADLKTAKKRKKREKMKLKKKLQAKNTNKETELHNSDESTESSSDSENEKL